MDLIKEIQEITKSTKTPSALRENFAWALSELAKVPPNRVNERLVQRVVADRLISNNSQIQDEALLSKLERMLSLNTVQPPSSVNEVQISTRIGNTEIGLCRADITKVKMDVIVNAANSRGLGCFQPSHRCVDNVIHRAAGPRLREVSYYSKLLVVYSKS
jgi:hypothetical protein